MDPNLLGELYLRQLALASELTNFSSNEFELRGPVHHVCR